MPTFKIDREVVCRYAKAFAEEDRLQRVFWIVKRMNIMFSFDINLLCQPFISKFWTCGKTFPLSYLGCSDSYRNQVGFNFLLNASGSLFSKSRSSLKDVEANVEAISAIMKASGGVGRFSALVIQESILKFYTDKKLFPVGVDDTLQCVQEWSAKQALALQRLVPCAAHH